VLLSLLLSVAILRLSHDRKITLPNLCKLHLR
jgi:hypothetical protein